MMRLAWLAVFSGAAAWQLPGVAVSPASTRLRAPTACAPPPEAPPPEPAAIASYEDAETRGFEFYQQGEYERAIRMFELAQTLPGAGVDYTREKSSGMIGSATAPPNPRGLKKEYFATPQQKLIAQYNIACCYGALGDKPQAMEIVRSYLSQVREPLDQINEMLSDADMAPLREEMRELREELKSEREKSSGGLFGFLPKLNMRELADGIGVEWKD